MVCCVSVCAPAQTVFPWLLFLSISPVPWNKLVSFVANLAVLPLASFGFLRAAHLSLTPSIWTGLVSAFPLFFFFFSFFAEGLEVEKETLLWRLNSTDTVCEWLFAVANEEINTYSISIQWLHVHTWLIGSVQVLSVACFASFCIHPGVCACIHPAAAFG